MWCTCHFLYPHFYFYSIIFFTYTLLPYHTVQYAVWYDCIIQHSHTVPGTYSTYTHSALWLLSSSSSPTSLFSPTFSNITTPQTSFAACRPICYWAFGAALAEAGETFVVVMVVYFKRGWWRRGRKPRKKWKERWVSKNKKDHATTPRKNHSAKPTPPPRPSPTPH